MHLLAPVTVTNKRVSIIINSALLGPRRRGAGQAERRRHLVFPRGTAAQVPRPWPAGALPPCGWNRAESRAGAITKDLVWIEKHTGQWQGAGAAPSGETPAARSGRVCNERPLRFKELLSWDSPSRGSGDLGGNMWPLREPHSQEHDNCNATCRVLRPRGTQGEVELMPWHM